MFSIGKKGTKNFTTPYSIPKVLHNFHKKGQHLVAGCMKGLNYGLIVDNPMSIPEYTSFEAEEGISSFEICKNVRPKHCLQS